MERCYIFGVARSWGLVVFALGACTDGGTLPADAVVDSVPIDADPCAAPATVPSVPGCVFAGLGAVSLDGAWTMTGTTVSFHGAPEPFTSTIYLKRSGSGGCSFAMSPTPILDDQVLDRYIDDTWAHGESPPSLPHQHQESWRLCVRESDGALAYTSSIYRTMPPMDRITDAVLSR